MMTDPGTAAPTRVVITGMSATSAFGRGTEPLLAGALVGRPAFRQAGRFSVARRRAKAAAELPGTPVLADELTAVIGGACDMAGLRPAERGSATLLLALHTDAAAARKPGARSIAGNTAAVVAARSGLPDAPRVYATACVAASTAIADAAAMIVSGRADRVVVAAGYLVDEDSFGLFDGGRVLARDGQVRPFNSGRQGLLPGDGVAAVVLESAATAWRRNASPLAWLVGWGRAGDAYHVCQPCPDGSGLGRAIGAALRRARVEPTAVGYVNANGSGTSYADSSEAAALRLALGGYAGEVPVSSTKSVHGRALEASALLEFVLTVLVLRAGRLPINAGFLAPDEDCPLNLVLASTTGDIANAAAVANAVDDGRAVPPLLFYQSNPNAVAGYIAARWGLAGPVVCTIPAGRGLADALDSAALLIEGSEADAALVVLADQGGPDGDRGVAMLVGPAQWLPARVATQEKSRPSGI